jgi:hypothetical protein
MILWSVKSEDGDAFEASRSSRVVRLVCFTGAGIGFVQNTALICPTRATSRCLCDSGSASFGGFAWS